MELPLCGMHTRCQICDRFFAWLVLKPLLNRHMTLVCHNHSVTKSLRVYRVENIGLIKDLAHMCELILMIQNTKLSLRTFPAPTTRSPLFPSDIQPDSWPHLLQS